MAFRVSFFFQIQSDIQFGWSMSFWFPGTQLSSAVAATNDLRGALYALTGNRVDLPRVRISNVDNFRLIQIIRYPSEPFPVTTPSIEADFPNTAFELKLTGSGGAIVRQQIRGIKDGQIQDGGRYKPIGNALTQLNTFLGLLKTGGWQLRCLAQVIPKPPVEIIDATGVVTATGHGLGIGVKKVRLSRNGVLPTSFVINKIWQAKAIDADHFQLLGWVTPPGFLFYKPGTYSIQNFAYQAIADAVVERGTSHKTGRPTALATGRRRTRRTG
jgi:hypothetical protein